MWKYQAGPSVYLWVIVTSVSKKLLVDCLHAKKERECLEKGTHRSGAEVEHTFQEEQQLVIHGSEELGIILMGEVMDGARKGESWTFSHQH